LIDFLPGPGLGIDLGVLECDLDLQRIVVQAPEALHQVQSVAMRMAQRINPGRLVYRSRINHQRVAFILADRMPHPRARIPVGMSSPIHVDSAHPVIHLGKDVNLNRGLTDLEWPGASKNTCRPRWITAIAWIGIVSPL